jgi:hypothetical protein
MQHINKEIGNYKRGWYAGIMPSCTTRVDTYLK